MTSRLHIRHVVAEADESDALLVISKWPSKLNGFSVDSSTYAVEPCDVPWLLGRYKAVSAGLSGTEMAEFFSLRGSFSPCRLIVLYDSHILSIRSCAPLSPTRVFLVRCRSGTSHNKKRVES